MPMETNEESLSHLQWWQISKSKDAEYFTPADLSDIIYQSVKHLIKPESSLVFDPTAGIGRLLKPFKKNKFKVFGIEYKENLAIQLKKAIGKNNVRCGDLLDYYPDIPNIANCVIANPPFGLSWIPDNIYFDCNKSSGKIESQSATIELIHQSLLNNGIAVVIIPTSTWTNSKDKMLVDYIYKNFNVKSIITINNIFKKEYNINVKCDLVYLQRKVAYYSNYSIGNPIKSELEYSEILQIPDIIKNILFLDIPTIDNPKERIKDIPEYSRLTTYTDISNDISVSDKGISGSSVTLSLLDFYEHAKLQDFNSVMGNLSGIKECYFSLPSLIRNGLEPTVEFCKNIDISFKYDDKQLNKFRKLQKKWEDIAIPIYKPKSHELLAYFKYGKYKAKKDIIDQGKLIFKKNKEYLIKPTWIRKSEEVDRENVTNAKGDPTGEIKIRSINQGYLQLEVESEITTLKFPETDTEQIKRFLEIFDLPDVKGVAEIYPDRVKVWSNILSKKFGFLKPLQAEDLSRALCKKNVYFGHDMGFGKTVMVLCYYSAKKYSRVLIQCKGQLIENWVDDANKFNMKITVLKSHNDIWRLKQRIKNKDFKKHSTEFFVIGHEFMSLDGGKVFEPWNCVKYNKEGDIIHGDYNITKSSCSKNHRYEVMIKKCPKCEATWNEGWTGRYCHSCGYIAYTYGKMSEKSCGYKNFIRKIENKLTLEDLSNENIEINVGIRQYPAYKNLNKLFSAVITDESQHFANRSLRGEASRSIKSISKSMLSGTIMKGYVKDVFLNFGWLLGYENPIFYFKRNDIKRFLDEFGSYETLSYDYLNEMKDASMKNRKSGMKKLLPAVSNLNRFWRIISPFTIRRTIDEIEEIKNIKVNDKVEYLQMDDEHYNLYVEYHEWAKKLIKKELRKSDEEINLGVISKCLWRLRFVASVPNSPALLEEKNNLSSSPNINLEKDNWNKINRLVEILEEKKSNNEKVIVYSGLIALQGHTVRYLSKLEYKVKFINQRVKSKNRTVEIKDFANNDYDVLVTGNKILNEGFNGLTCASTIVHLDEDYTPYVLDQSKGRIRRIGQNHKDIFIYHLLSEGTIDEDIFNLCKLKREAIHSAIDKKARYSNTKDLLEQADKRNPELAIANDIHKNNMIRKTIKPIPVDNPFNEYIKSDDVQINHTGIVLGDDEQYILAL